MPSSDRLQIDRHDLHVKVRVLSAARVHEKQLQYTGVLHRSRWQLYVARCVLRCDGLLVQYLRLSAERSELCHRPRLL